MKTFEAEVKVVVRVVFQSRYDEDSEDFEEDYSTVIRKLCDKVDAIIGCEVLDVDSLDVHPKEAHEH